MIIQPKRNNNMCFDDNEFYGPYTYIVITMDISQLNQFIYLLSITQTVPQPFINLIIRNVNFFNLWL